MVGYTLPLALRRVFPVSVLVLVLLAVGIDTGLDYPQTLARIAPVLGLHAIGTELSPRRSLLVGGGAVLLTVAWTTIGAVLYESVPWAAPLTQLIATGVPLHLGREVHRRRARMDELRDRAERAELQREERARQAVAEERARIARELHDVVAHQMTVMTLQADGAGRVAGSDPRVASALSTIRDTGREALVEMRRVVGVLRAEDGDATLSPLPRLADLEELVASVGAAGVPVTLDVRGTVRELDDGVQLQAYRIVQESLTNTVRHGGPGTSATVVLDFGGDGLDLVVEDDGRGAAAEQDAPGGGHGLIGMRERVGVLGGSFEAGPRRGGGFRVHASIPYSP